MNVSSENGTLDTPFSYSFTYEVATAVFMTLVSIAIMVGNVVTIIAVFKFPKLRVNVTNNLIVSLSSADLLLALPLLVRYNYLQFTDVSIYRFCATLLSSCVTKLLSKNRLSNAHACSKGYHMDSDE